MDADLKDKVAIVTGGTSGIGRDAAILFSKAGAKVVVAGRREPEGKQVVDAIHAAGGDALFVQTDVAKPADAQALVKKNRRKIWPPRHCVQQCGNRRQMGPHRSAIGSRL